MAMMGTLQKLGLGIILLGVVIGIGLIVLYTMGNNLSACPTGYTYNNNGTTAFTSNLCCKSTGWSNCASAGNQTDPAYETRTLNSIGGYLGTSNGGLASWIPLVIVLLVGLFFIGSFIGKRY